MFPIWMIAPFLTLLACIALLPILAEHFWHSNFRKAVVSLGVSLPVVAYLAWHQFTTGQPSFGPLWHALLEYLEFIVPLTALYAVAGGIVLEGDIRPTTLANSLLLTIGAILTNLVGTTGASMLLIRPMLRINQSRKSPVHVPVFFIFMVSNTGGLLTPVGDPPLLLGFLHGVDFFWTLSLWPHWLMANGLILAAFVVSDLWIRNGEPGPEPAPGTSPIRVVGLINVAFLAGILLAILLQSEVLANELTAWLRRFLPCPNLHLDQLWSTLVMGLMTGLSLLCTPGRLRRANDFAWTAMVEVAVLFVGIFTTMVPVLSLLKEHSQDFFMEKAWQYFWLTGSLSAFLDNAPTYLTFATVAAGATELDGLMLQRPQVLQAISSGAVFLGAMTYIGNAPNFMVKAIAEAAGYRMPSFFAYMLRAALVLLPICLVITLVFFRG